ncbi:MAG: hypothetical protein KAS29_18905, partial [Bacteroidales bacterium]|nr:hypothetical protein [Bacteroidales bacterium]
MKKTIIALAIILFAGVAFGQTLKEGGVLALHHHQVTLATGVTIDQYFDFLQDSIIAEMQKVFPKTPSKILKGIGENNQHEYGLLYYWESLELFRTYWNADGTPTEKGAAAMAQLQPLIEKLNTLGTYTQVPGDWL